MLYAKHESNQCGTDWTLICKDLKTVRGVKSRIARGVWPEGGWWIYRCAESDWYKDTGHTVVGMFYKARLWLA